MTTTPTEFYAYECLSDHDWRVEDFTAADGSRWVLTDDGQTRSWLPYDAIADFLAAYDEAGGDYSLACANGPVALHDDKVPADVVAAARESWGIEGVHVASGW